MFDIINQISDPQCAGISMADVGVGYDNAKQNLLWGNNVCYGGIKEKKVVQLGINIRYMVTIFLWVKSQYVFGGAHGKLYVR